MAYLQFNDYYRQLLLSGRLPMPYPPLSPYIHSAPNLVNENCECGLVNQQLGSWGPIENDLCYYPWHHQYNHYLSGSETDCFDLPFQDPSFALNFIGIELVSNGIGCARNIDLGLSDPWGLVIIGDVIWVANAGSGLITKYNLIGQPLFPSVNVFGPVCNVAQPTGIVFNCNPASFPLVKGPICEFASIIVATRDGTINGYNSEIDECQTMLLVDSSMNNTVYTGLELVNDVLFAVDFYNQRIDVYDCHLVKIMVGRFVDECVDDLIPCDFSPYNIVNIGDVFYVTYARQSPIDNQFESCGVGCGFINIFSLDGIFIRRFASRCFLNAPYGIMLAPSAFGYPAGSLLVANFGDSTVSVYNCDGVFINKIKDKCGNDIYIGGVRGLYVNPIHDRIVYWTSRGNNLKEAFVGSINIGNEC